MKADLSRGHKPDQKRGQKYRRVFLQQGRLLLDSDFAAMNDALDVENRDLGRYTGGEAGSPDLGFLITPGRLLAFFHSLDAVTPGQSNDALFRYHLDFTRKYLSRLASLYLGAQLGHGELTVAFRHAVPPSGVVRLWARIPAGTVLSVQFDPNVSPVNVNGTGAETFKLYEVTAPAGGTSYPSLTFWIATAADSTTKELWIGLIEEKVPAASAPNFWVKEGRYLLDGLTLELGADGLFPGVSFEDPITGSTHGNQIDGTVNVGDLFLAYLEGWERLITAVEDPGVLERALGGSIDTCARSRVVGQVKLARCSGLSDADAILKSFGTLKSPAGTLSIGEATQTASQDPCAIPEVEGYSGSDNRLYRFEVHKGGGLGDFEIKWSRNNGADLYRVLSVQTSGGVSRLTLASGIDLRDGDLVEFLGETAELGDGTPGSVDGAGFTPAERAVGPLYYVREVPEAPGQIELFDDSLNASVLLSAELSGQSIPKLRRWHGVLKPPAGNTGSVAFTVDGIEVTIGGPLGGIDSFRPGDYWQYEARRLYANDNGTFDESPHGPERVFAALGLLKFNGASEPLELLRWYDGPFSPFGDLKADHVAYYDGRANPTAHTVQDAIDELFARHDDGCCYVDMEPLANPVDDAARIINLIQTELPTGGVICLRPGVYWLRSQISITNMRIEIRGCPDAVLVSDANGQTPIVVGAGGELTLSGFVYCTSGSNPGPGLIEVNGDARLSVKECGLLHLGPNTGSVLPGTAIITSEGNPPTIFTMAEPTYVIPYPLPSEPLTAVVSPKVELEDCVVVANWGISIPYTEGLSIRDSACYAKSGVVYAKELQNLDISGSVLAVALTDVHFDTLRQQELDAVGKHARTLLESLELDSPGAGTAFYALEIFGGSVTGSMFFGSIGFFAAFASRLETQGNQYAGRYGIRLDNVADSSLSGERIDVKGDIILEGTVNTVPIGMMIIRSALKLIVSSCSVQVEGASSSVGAGIVLTTRLSNGEVLARRFQGVLIHGNRINSSGTAMVVRHENASDDATDSLPDRILVRANYIEQSGSYGIYCANWNATQASPSRVTIVGNHIETASVNINYAYGIYVNAPSVVVKGNYIIAHADGNETDAICVSYADDVVIENNLIDLESGTALGTKDVMGIRAEVSVRTRIVGNVVNACDTYSARGPNWSLYTYICDYLTVEGNDFGDAFYGVDISWGTDLLFRNNRVRCNIKVSPSNGSRAVVTGNHLERGSVVQPIASDMVDGVSGPHLVIYEASGSFDVSGNFAPGCHIVFRPWLPSGGEYSYNVSVMNNYAGNIIVGHYDTSTSTYATPNTNSGVQVTGNKATGTIRVNAYERLVLANNMAPNVFMGSAQYALSTAQVAHNRA